MFKLTLHPFTKSLNKLKYLWRRPTLLVEMSHDLFTHPLIDYLDVFLALDLGPSLNPDRARPSFTNRLRVCWHFGCAGTTTCSGLPLALDQEGPAPEDSANTDSRRLCDCCHFGSFGRTAWDQGRSSFTSRLCEYRFCRGAVLRDPRRPSFNSRLCDLLPFRLCIGCVTCSGPRRSSFTGWHCECWSRRGAVLCNLRRPSLNNRLCDCCSGGTGPVPHHGPPPASESSVSPPSTKRQVHRSLFRSPTCHLPVHIPIFYSSICRRPQPPISTCTFVACANLRRQCGRFCNRHVHNIVVPCDFLCHRRQPFDLTARALRTIACSTAPRMGYWVRNPNPPTLLSPAWQLWVLKPTHVLRKLLRKPSSRQAWWITSFASGVTAFPAWILVPR